MSTSESRNISWQRQLWMLVREHFHIFITILSHMVNTLYSILTFTMAEFCSIPRPSWPCIFAIRWSYVKNLISTSTYAFRTLYFWRFQSTTNCLSPISKLVKFLKRFLEKPCTPSHKKRCMQKHWWSKIGPHFFQKKYFFMKSKNSSSLATWLSKKPKNRSQLPKFAKLGPKNLGVSNELWDTVYFGIAKGAR